MANYNINAVTRRVVYTGSAGLGPYAFSFEILVETDVDVYFNTTLLTLTTDYTVTINANGTGSVTIVTGTSVPTTPDADDQITIVGSRDIERTTDFVTAGDFRASAINEQLDALTIFDQQLAESADRAIKAPVTDPTSINMTLPAKADRANAFLLFDADGDPSVQAAGTPGTPTSITRQQFSGDGSTVVFTLASDPQALGNSLSIYISGVYQQRATYTVSGTALTFSAAPPVGTNNIEVVNYTVTDIGSTDASLVTYTPAGTGAVERTVRSVLRETVSVTDFGAVGDGATDDTAAIQAAMDAAVAAGGSTVRIPAGSYNISSQLQHKGSVPIKLIGEGHRKTLLVATASFNAIIDLAGAACGTAADTAGTVDTFTIVDGGYYTSAPTATVTGDGTTPPTVTAVLTGNTVTSITIDTAGSADFTEAWIEFSASPSPSLGFHAEEIGFVTAGYNTHCINANRNSSQYIFDKCRFAGNGTSALIENRGDFANIQNCVFACSAASTVGLNITASSIDSHIAHNRFGGVGRGVKIDTLYAGQDPDAGGSNNRPQGITFLDNHMICTGLWNFSINKCLYINFTENWIVESATYQVYIANSASHINFLGGYIGGGGSTAACVHIDSTVGNAVSFVGVDFNYGSYAVYTVATASENLDQFIFSNCSINNIATTSLHLNSVSNAVITGNVDRGTPTNGSWVTVSSHTSIHGDYRFANNAWDVATPPTIDTTATYHNGIDDLSPSFSLMLSSTVANVTGTGTLYDIVFDTEIFDDGNNCTTTTFTAPISGRYQLNSITTLSGLTGAADIARVNLITSNRTYRSSFSQTNDLQGSQTLNINTLADMDAGDTAYVQVYALGEASDVVDVFGSSVVFTGFSGYLVK
jgi:hypothetical protein